jgi:hypothetical protein
MASRVPEVVLRQIPLPQENAPLDPPAIAASEYAWRCSETLARAGTPWVAVYGDREHNANLLYLIGFDPRFEEALLLLGPDERRILLVGNEGEVHAAVVGLAIELALYQSFSLMGQPRETATSLDRTLQVSGLAAGDRVGIAGWKYFTPSETADPARPAWVPAAIADATKRVTGIDPVDVTPVLLDPVEGLRARGSADQIAVHAWGALRASQAVFRVIHTVRHGITEREAAAAMGYAAEPMSIHPILASGAPGQPINGLRSASGREIGLGDGIGCAVGYWGGLCARAGIVEDAVGIKFFSNVVRPYFLAHAAWYAAIGIGVAGGEVAAAVESALTQAGASFRSMLNPGHLTSYDEWVHSPIATDSFLQLASGMTLQCDIIPTPLPAGTALNCEDTVVLADDALRAKIAERHPTLWARIERNRDLMQRQLGFTLRPETLPLSLANGYLPPGWFSPSYVCTLAN